MSRVDKIKDMLRENPSDSFLQHALALEYIKLGKEAEAKHIFQNLLQQEPGYVGSYYHLAKLLERTGETDAAVAVYKKGMEEAQKAGDQHSYNELKSAYEELIF